MSESNKLTVEEVEALLVHGINGVIEERAHDLASQLADTMRENERLKAHPLKLICEKCGVLTDVEHANKDTNHIVDPNKMVPGDHSEHILELVPDAGNATKDTEPEMCPRCTNNPVMHRGSEKLCCWCYVAGGSAPADWHPECMKAYRHRTKPMGTK